MDREGRVRRSARKKLIYGTNSHECICETLRTIYDEVHGLKDEKLKEAITEKLVDAFIMAKKMQYRLLYYHDKYNEPSGFTPKRIYGSQLKKQMRKAR